MNNIPVPPAVKEQLIDLFDLWKKIVLSPKVFFENMPLEGGLREPLIFMAAIATINGVCVFLLYLLLLRPLEGIVGAVSAVGMGLAGSFICSGITMFLARALGGSGDFEKTYRACVYASAPGVLGWMMFINVFAGMYSLYLLRLGLERSHEMPTSKATVVVGIEIGISLLIGLSVAISTAGSMLSHTAGGGAGVLGN